jgi:uncharacterized protein (TIGR03382 family)
MGRFAHTAGEPVRPLLRVLLSFAIAWSLVIFLLFVVSAVTHRWPRQLELPWSSVSDFVVTPEGRVVLYSEFFQRLLVYDLDGKFLLTLPGVPARGEHYLAADVQGHLYISTLESICSIEMGEDAEAICRRGPPGTVGWRLGEDGTEAIVGEPPAPVPDWPADVGETLFSYVGNDQAARQAFHADGAEIMRRDDCLHVRKGERASRVQICSPWYLKWAKFPLPAAFAWLLLIALSIAQRRRRRST